MYNYSFFKQFHINNNIIINNIINNNIFNI